VYSVYYLYYAKSYLKIGNKDNVLVINLFLYFVDFCRSLTVENVLANNARGYISLVMTSDIFSLKLNRTANINKKEGSSAIR
jgi:hypothetical protein